MSKLGIIADDLTGATTVGVLLARSNIPVAAYFDSDNLSKDKEQEAFILTTDSRAIKKEDAKARVKEAVISLKENGVTYLSKRIDTTLRGNIGAEVEAMLELMDEDTIGMMVPAMPQSKRILVGGYSIIDSVPLSQTPVAKDVRTPVEESHCPTLIKKQTDYPVETISLNTILAGKESLKKSLRTARNNGAKIIIADAVSLEHIDLIAQVISGLKWNVLMIDPGPFTERMAYYNGFKKEVEALDKEIASAEQGNGTVLAVAGSASPVTKEQIHHLSRQENVIQIPVIAKDLICCDEVSSKEIKRVIDLAVNHLKKASPQALIIETSVTNERVDLKAVEKRNGLQPGESADNINKALGEITKGILLQTSKIKGIYMTGGDTMVHILKTLEAVGIKLLDYVIPQADLGVIIGGYSDGLVVVGKGGLTGSIQTAADIVERIMKEASVRTLIEN
ncbi:four-carbon acid sugar kinase family protein [Oceanobacillus sojae]|uniref:four-carbon acid sugar kinase family protein n=1 Tax=Oceanobacillus sojae TaxID=582851 RepID=UPI00098852EA|nr:four-carbon acid sugar kinase family protein [Oceanobacillus sojae]MCT1903195.1 four-carbon acid sugar kinase family protein [Oceanobacillus sojae]